MDADAVLFPEINKRLFFFIEVDNRKKSMKDHLPHEPRGTTMAVALSSLE